MSRNVVLIASISYRFRKCHSRMYLAISVSQMEFVEAGSEIEMPAELILMLTF